MKKILLIGCIMIFVCCAPKKTIVETEGLEEVVVFGEEESNISEEPVLPQPLEEEVVAPPVTEEEPAPPPITEEEVVTPPPIEEEPAPPPITEEEVVTPPPIEEEPAPPPILEEEIVALPPPPIAEEEPYVPPTVTPTAPPPTPAPAKLLGFRIQIFASSTEKNASKVADDTRASFTENTYVEHVIPYYKVRVGDCLTREDAEILKNKALRLGFRGAFVVETMITP